MTTKQIASLQPALRALLAEFRPFFKRESTFRHWEFYLLGLMADLKRKSIEPIALAAGVAVRTLQEFLAFFVWDDQRINNRLQQLVMDEHGCDHAIAIIDACAHAKRGAVIWEVKAARVHLVDRSTADHNVSCPTDRLYWLIAARHATSGEMKYFVSNAPARVSLKEMMSVALCRWHVEKWFERAKQEAGFGAFEVRTYSSLIRHWLCARVVMYFLATQTKRLRGEKSADHLGASGRCGQYTGLEDLETLVVGLDRAGQALPIRPAQK